MSKLEQIEGLEKGKILGPLTTFQMGGEADYYLPLKDVMKLPEVIEICLEEEIPYIILGWGSNLIFSDKGFRGLVIHNLGRKMEVDEEVMARGIEGETSYRPAGRLVSADSGI